MGLPGLGCSGTGDGLGWSTASVNHELSSLPQPSPPPADGCGLHSGLSPGQRSCGESHPLFSAGHLVRDQAESFPRYGK
jgi:hypothetical protein